LIEKHIHHIQPKYLIGEDNSPDNLTPPISVALHAALHKDLYEHFGNTEDEIAYKSLLGMSLNGIIYTPELRDKISIATKKAMEKPEVKRKHSESHKGIKYGPRSENVKKKISRKLKGIKRNFSEEHKKKLSTSLKNFYKEKKGELYVTLDKN